LCDDKASFNRHLVDIGLGGFLPDVNSPRSFPYILKKRIDEWAENCHIVFDREQEKILYNSIRNPSEYFSQELVPGSEEFATHLIIKNGSIKCAINIKYKFKHEFPIKGKDPLIYASIWPSYYLDVFASILRSIGFEGLCCVNYKILGGRPKILEINPRFGGSLAPYFFRFAEKICAGAEATSEAAPAATSPTH
jgi:carbamoylphosphate synthase large subunit